MQLLADGLVMFAASVAALYCWILSRRLRSLNDTKNGLGGAIASLTRQVEEVQRSLAEAKTDTQTEAKRLAALVEKAESVAAQVEAGLNRSARVARARRAARERTDQSGSDATSAAATPLTSAQRMGALKELVEGLRA